MEKLLSKLNENVTVSTFVKVQELPVDEPHAVEEFFQLKTKFGLKLAARLIDGRRTILPQSFAVVAADTEQLDLLNTQTVYITFKGIDYTRKGKILMELTKE